MRAKCETCERSMGLAKILESYTVSCLILAFSNQEKYPSKHHFVHRLSYAVWPLEFWNSPNSRLIIIIIVYRKKGYDTEGEGAYIFRSSLRNSVDIKKKNVR